MSEVLRMLADKWDGDAEFYLRAGEGDKCVAYGRCAKELRAALGAQPTPQLCVECGQPTMHMGNLCFACGKARKAST